MVTDAMVEAAARVLLGSVNAPENMIYRAARASLEAALAAVPVGEVEEFADFIEKCVAFTEVAAEEGVNIAGLDSEEIIFANPFDREGEGFKVALLAASLPRTLSAEVARLTAERDAERFDADYHRERMRHAIAERDAAIRERDHLLEAIRTVVETDDHFVATETYRDDGVLSKHDKCAHGNRRYEGCESCAATFLETALASIRQTKGGEHDR
jgi:hypothetical protein